MTTQISDENWFEYNLDPKRSPISLPGLPDPKIQVRFTGRAGRDNLEQAFEFYKFVLHRLPQDSGAKYRVLDFGGGWGRILRFFLRDIPADRLALADCLTDAIECAKSLDPPYKIVMNDVNPPLPFDRGSVDACYAFSVFSHLSEMAARKWIAHLSTLLVSGGKLFITTRGRYHIEGIRSFREQKQGHVDRFKTIVKKMIGRHDHAAALRTKLPHPDQISKLLDQGTLQFYPTGGGGELSDDFYGETWIPEKWIRDNFRSLGFQSYECFPEFGTIDQCVFVLSK